MARQVLAAVVIAALALLLAVWRAAGDARIAPSPPTTAAQAPRLRTAPERRRRVERRAAPEQAAPEAAMPAEESMEPIEPVGPPRADPVAWLLARQDENGSWAPEADSRVCRTELTATVVLYLLALGPDGMHDGALDRALVWLAGRMAEIDGRILDPVLRYDRRAHATAALALTEAGAMNPNLRRRYEPERAVAHLVRDVAGDAFRRVGADRVTEVEAATWAAMALRSGSLGGADVTRAELDRARNNLRAFFGDSTDVAFDDRSVAMLACADVLLGADPAQDERLRRGVDALLQRTADGRLDDPRLAYFGTLAAYQVGGDTWETWRTRLDAVPHPLDDAAGAGCSVHSVATRAMADAIVARWDIVFGGSR